MSLATKGALIVVSGFSGAGKGTLMKNLMKNYGESYALSISATSRAPRPGEEDGREYFFVTRERFEEMIAQSELVEYAQYVGNYYGTPKAYVMQQLEAGKNVILEIEIQGALKIKKQFPEACLMFVSAPSATELRNRLVGRGTEAPEVIDQRLNRACEESQGVEAYDYWIVNDDLDATTVRIHNIIENVRNNHSERNSEYTVSANEGFVNKMRDELMSFSKGE